MKQSKSNERSKFSTNNQKNNKNRGDNVSCIATSANNSNFSASSTSYRLARVQTLLRRELGRGLLKLRDPRVSMVTISDMKISPDLSFARIYITVLELEHAKETIAVLNKATGFFRGIIAENWSLRIIPKLCFELDNKAVENHKLNSLLMQVAEELELTAASQ